jgi:hypothetical protein
MIISAPTDYREAAERRLPRFLFDYIDGGAVTERTLKQNISPRPDRSHNRYSPSSAHGFFNRIGGGLFQRRQRRSGIRPSRTTRGA